MKLQTILSQDFVQTFIYYHTYLVRPRLRCEPLIGMNSEWHWAVQRATAHAFKARPIAFSLRLVIFLDLDQEQHCWGVTNSFALRAVWCRSHLWIILPFQIFEFIKPKLIKPVQTKRNRIYLISFYNFYSCTCCKPSFSSQAESSL